MKKYILLFTVLMLVFVSNPQKVTAEDTAPLNAPTPTEMKAKIDAGLKLRLGEIKKQAETKTSREEAKIKMEALRENIKNEKDTIKAKIKETRIANREKLLTRFDKIIIDLTNLKDKIYIQINNLGIKGINTTNARISIVIAENKLIEINTKIASVNTLLAKNINELTVEDKATLKILTSDIQNLIKETKEALNDTIKSLRENIKIKNNADKAIPNTTNPTGGNTTSQTETTNQ